MPTVPTNQRAQGQGLARPQVAPAEYLMAAAVMEEQGLLPELKRQEEAMELGHILGPSDEDIVKQLQPRDKDV